MSEDRTALYRYFDAEGRLLYVGVSLSAIQRQMAHEASSPWYRSHASMTTEWFASRAKALQAERTAIISEEPAYNVVHRNEELDDSPSSLQANRSRAGRLGALTIHAAGKTNTAPARAKFMSRFEQEVDPEGLLDAATRAKRAAYAKRAYFTRLALRRHGGAK